jgi:hypothetical protein
MNLDLRPGEGIGDLLFGMNPAAIEQKMNEPSTYEEWMGGNLNDAMLYAGLILIFDRFSSSGPLPDSRFVQAIVHDRSDASFAGRALAHWSKADLIDHLHSNQIPFSVKAHGGLDVENGLWFRFNMDGSVDEAGVNQHYVAAPRTFGARLAAWWRKFR